MGEAIISLPYGQFLLSQPESMLNAQSETRIIPLAVNCIKVTLLLDFNIKIERRMRTS